MRARATLVWAVAAIAITVSAMGPRSLLPDIRQHLQLARRSAFAGRATEAIAHASVVEPATLRIRIDCRDLAPPDQGLLRDALAGAIDMWQSALDQQVFIVTETGAADVTVHFLADVSDRGMEVCGHTQWTRGVLDPDTNPRAIFRADVQIRTARPGGEPMTFEQVRACAAHELGHVLGMSDSEVPGDLMGRMDFGHPALTIRREEVQSLIDARSEAARIRNRFSLGRDRSQPKR